MLADDQGLVRAGFRMILGSDADIEVVGEAAHGEHALTLTCRLRPHLGLGGHLLAATSVRRPAFARPNHSIRAS